LRVCLSARRADAAIGPSTSAFKLLQKKTNHTSPTIQAAEDGIADAQSDLGDRYYDGEGGMKDFSEAAKWYRKSADQGNEFAQYSLGFMKYRGQGVVKNEDEALIWLHKSADQGNESAKKEITLIEDNRRQAEQAAEARRMEQENQKKRISQVGQQICRNEQNVTMSKPTQYVVMGERQYQKIQGKAEFVGFVEGSSGNRIQIRISGITFVSPDVREAMQSFDNYNGSTLTVGGIIWDEYSGWFTCSYR
jgi:TPR repeat protein